MNYEKIKEAFEGLKPDFFILINTEDFTTHKKMFMDVLRRDADDRLWYENIRVIHSSYAEKGMIKPLPTSILERFKVNFSEPIIGWDTEDIDKPTFKIRQFLTIEPIKIKNPS